MSRDRVFDDARVLDDTWLDDAENVPRAFAENVEPRLDDAEDVKTIAELFGNAYTKDPMPRDLLGQLRRGQTRSRKLYVRMMMAG